MQHLFRKFVLSLVLCFYTAEAQDAAFIQPNPKNYSVRPYVFVNILDITVNDEAQHETTYIPNNPFNIGASISHSEFPIAIDFSYSLQDKEEENRLRTQALDFQINQYGRFYVADLFLKHYKGLYIDDESLSQSEADCPDISVVEIGILAQYIFSPNRFSYQAAFNQSERQIRSAGSFILGVGLNYFRISSDSSFVFKGESSMAIRQVGLHAGYAYNWVIFNNWLLSASLNAGMNLSENNLSPTVITRNSIFYNETQWSLGFSFLLNTISLEHPNESVIELTMGRFELAIVRRFLL